MKKKTKGTLRIGISNVVVPGNKQSFPAEFKDKSRLNYYSSLFNTVELNSPFYKIPMPATFERWADDVPDNFRFSVKLFREITHSKNLSYDPAYIDKFLQAVARLGKKKGCLLIQFPGKINLEHYNQVEQILERIKTQDDNGGWRVAVEFRDASWYVKETFELLDEYEAAMVLHDIPKSKNFEVNTAPHFIYQRFHGPKGDYRGGYGADLLKEKKKLIQNWLAAGKDIYVYFNNTIGDAFTNAQTLQRLIS